MSRPPIAIVHRRRFQRFRFLLSCLIILGIAWAGGFLWYVNIIPTKVEFPDKITDAIVVLTGGSERLSEGRRLLGRHMAKKLFISGVYRGVEVDELLSARKSDPKLLSCCVVLGHIAENTRGNAQETAVWVHQQGYKSLRIVTANYHMPRSLLEFKSLMPDVEMIAHPVFPNNVKVTNWWRYPNSALLIASEYNKYMFASLRNKILELLPAHENRLPFPNSNNDEESSPSDTDENTAFPN